MSLSTSSVTSFAFFWLASPRPENPEPLTCSRNGSELQHPDVQSQQTEHATALLLAVTRNKVGREMHLLGKRPAVHQVPEVRSVWCNVRAWQPLQFQPPPAPRDLVCKL